MSKPYSVKIQELFNQKSDIAFERITWLAEHAKDEAVQLKAAMYVVDRQYGKIPQPLTGTDDGSPIVVKVINYGDKSSV